MYICIIHVVPLYIKSFSMSLYNNLLSADLFDSPEQPVKQEQLCADVTAGSRNPHHVQHQYQQAQQHQQPQDVHPHPGCKLPPVDNGVLSLSAWHVPEHPTPSGAWVIIVTLSLNDSVNYKLRRNFWFILS